MKPWRFLDYWPREGENPIRLWEKAQNEKVRAAFDAALDALRQTEDWRDREDLYRELERDECGMGEIIFETEEKQKGSKKMRRRRFRAFVKLRKDSHDCILFGCCEHWPRHRPYDPPNAPQMAKKRSIAFEANQGFVYGHL